MTTHTAGPWHVTDGLKAILSADDRVVADIRGQFRNGYEVDETAANARLIAAAPDLLAALKTITDLLASTRDFQLNNESPECYLAVVSARAAIRKAEGAEVNR